MDDLFDRLRRIQLAERRHATMSALEPDFYAGVNKRLAELSKDPGDLPVEELREYQNILRISQDITARRRQKLVAKSQHDLANNSISSEGLASEEREFYLSLVGLLKDFDSMVKVGDLASIQPEHSLKPRSEARAEPGKVKVRMLSDVPEFVSSDLSPIGPFGQAQVVELARIDADLLINRSLASLAE